jgi:N4-gp56 family major capsid protein
VANEVGLYAGTRFLQTAYARLFVDGGAASADVASTFVFGPGAYCVADSQTLATYFVPPGGNHSDPLAQLAKVGWKYRGGAMLVDEAGPRYIRLESAMTLQG